MRSAAILAAALCAGGCVTQTAADGDGDGEPQDGVGGPNEQPRPQPSFLPEPHGECPVFADGELTFDAKSGKRKVQIWLRKVSTHLRQPWSDISEHSRARYG